MSDPLQGWEPGSTYGAYRDPEYTKRALAAQQKEEQKKKSATVKPGTKPTTKSGTTPATKAKAKPKKNQQTWNPAEVVGQGLKQTFAPVMDVANAAAKGLENTSDFLAQAAGQDPKARAQQKAKRQQELAKTNQAMSKEMAGPKEMARIALKSTGPGIIENVVDTTLLIGDTLQQPLRAVTGTYDATKDPFNDRYVRAQTDLGITPKTEGGKKAARLLQFFNATRAATRLSTAAVTKITGQPQRLSQALNIPKGKGAQTIVDNIPGAISGFIMASPEDPETLSNFAQDFVPDAVKPLFFLAADGEQDNLYQIKLKGALDNLGLDVIGDVIGSMFKGRNFFRKAKEAGADDEEALTGSLKEMSDEADTVATKADVDYRKEGEKWNDTREVQLNQLLEQENFLRRELDSLDPADVRVQEINKKLEDIKIDQQEIDRAIVDNSYKEVWEKEGSFKQVNIEESIVAGRNWVTDAAVKRLNLEDSWKSIIQPAIKNLDPDALNAIYRNQGKAAWQTLKTKHIDALVDKFTEVMDSASSADEAKDLALKYLRQQGQTFTKASGEMIEDEAVIVVQATMQGMAEELAKVSKSLLDVDAAHLTNGNQADRLLDRLIGLMMLRKEGFSLDAGRRLLLGKFPSYKKMIEDAGNEADKTTLTPRMLKTWASDIKARIRAEDPTGIEEMRMLALAMSLAQGDPAKAINFGGTVLSSFGKESLGLYFNSILSGPKTIVRNLGAVIRIFAQPMEIGIRGVMEGDDRLIGAAGAGMIGAFSGLQDAIHVAAVTMKSGVPATWNEVSVLRKAERMAEIDAIADAAGDPAQRAAAGTLKFVHAINNWTDLPSRLMMSTDDFIKTVAVRQKIYEDAILKAFDARATNKGAFNAANELAIREFERNVDFKTGQIKDKALQEFAERATYQEDPGGFVNSLSNLVERANVLGIPVGKYMFPFVRTPANIMRYQLQMMPGATSPLLQNFMGGYKNAIATGDTLKIAEYQGREAIGSFLVSFGYTHAWSGHITGNMPMNKDERERWRQAGILPRSIKIGNQWVSYNWFEPLSNWIAAAADLGHMERNGSIKETEAVATRLGFAIAASFTEKSYLAGLDGLSLFTAPYETVTEFTKAKERFGEATGPADRATAAALGFVNSFIPGAGFRKAWANASDPYYREYESWTQKKLADMMPWLSKQNIPYSVSIISGKTMLNPGGGLRNATLPFEAIDINKDPVAQKLVELDVWPTIDYKKTQDGITLDPQARVRLQELMYDNGRLPNELKTWFNSTEFKQSQKKYEAKTLERGEEYIEPTFLRRTKEILLNAHGRASQALIAERPDLAEKIRKVGQLKFAQAQDNFSSQAELEQQNIESETQRIEQLINYGNP
jgi:hypothetical protein